MSNFLIHTSARSRTHWPCNTVCDNKWKADSVLLTHTTSINTIICHCLRCNCKSNNAKSQLISACAKNIVHFNSAQESYSIKIPVCIQSEVNVQFQFKTKLWQIIKMSKLMKRRKNNAPEFFIELFRQPPKIVIQSPSNNVNKQNRRKHNHKKNILCHWNAY